MVLKEDQERIKTLLKDTITLLCRNGLTFKTEFSIEALIGITLDKDDILLVNINEIIRTELGNKLAAAAEQSDQESVGDDWEDGSGDDVSPRGNPHSPSQKKRRKRHRSSGSQRNDGGGGGGHGDMSNTSFPDDSSTHSEPPVKRQSTLPNSRNSMKNENDDDSKDIVFIKEEVDTGDWSHTSQGPGHFPADLSGIPSQHQQEHFDNFLQGGSLVPVGAQQSSANLWSDMTGGPGSSMNQTMSPPGSKRSSTVTSNAAATPGDDSQQDIAFETGLLMEAEDGESSNDVSGPIIDVKPEKTKLKQSGQAPKKAHKHAVKFQLNESVDKSSESLRVMTDDENSTGLPPASDFQTPTTTGKGTTGFLCDRCPRSFSSKSSLKRHGKRHETYRVQCPSCPKKFPEKHELDAHIKRNHMGIWFDCHECGKAFRSKTGLDRHSQSHSGSYKYKCKLCGAGFAYRHMYDDHTIKHSGVKQFKCILCDAEFWRKRELDFHLTVCGKEPSIKCEECGKMFKSKKYLICHMQNHESTSQHQCSTCGKIFSHKASLRSHEKKKH